MTQVSLIFTLPVAEARIKKVLTFTQQIMWMQQFWGSLLLYLVSYFCLSDSGEEHKRSYFQPRHWRCTNTRRTEGNLETGSVKRRTAKLHKTPTLLCARLKTCDWGFLLSQKKKKNPDKVIISVSGCVAAGRWTLFTTFEMKEKNKTKAAPDLHEVDTRGAAQLFTLFNAFYKKKKHVFTLNPS